MSFYQLNFSDNWIAPWRAARKKKTAQHLISSFPFCFIVVSYRLRLFLFFPRRAILAGRFFSLPFLMKKFTPFLLVSTLSYFQTVFSSSQPPPRVLNGLSNTTTLLRLCFVRLFAQSHVKSVRLLCGGKEEKDGASNLWSVFFLSSWKKFSLCPSLNFCRLADGSKKGQTE